MRKKYDKFSIWLGITILGASILAFLILVKFQPGFFQDVTFLL